MKKLVAVLIIAGMMILSIGSAFAAGMPAAHNLSGRQFGGAVSGLARTNPQALVQHVSGR